MILIFPLDVDWRRITRRIAFEHGCQKKASRSVGLSRTAFSRYSTGQSNRPKYTGAARMLNVAGQLMPERYRELTGCDYVPLPSILDWALLVEMVRGAKPASGLRALYDDETWTAYRNIGNERNSVGYEPMWRNAALLLNFVSNINGGVDWMEGLSKSRRVA